MFQSLPQANLEILVDPALIERKTAPEAGRYDQRIKGQRTAKAVMKLRWTLVSQITPLRPTSNVAAQDLTSQLCHRRSVGIYQAAGRVGTRALPYKVPVRYVW